MYKCQRRLPIRQGGFLLSGRQLTLQSDLGLDDTRLQICSVFVQMPALPPSGRDLCCGAPWIVWIFAQFALHTVASIKLEDTHWQICRGLLYSHNHTRWQEGGGLIRLTRIISDTLVTGMAPSSRENVCSRADTGCGQHLMVK